MRVAITEVLSIGQAQAAEQINGRAPSFVLAGESVTHRSLDALIDKLMGGIERGGRRLRYIGDAGAPNGTALGFADLEEIHAFEQNAASCDAAARTRITHGGEPDGRLARPGFADQPEHLATPERQADPLDDRL